MTRVVSLSTVLFDGYPMEQAVEETARAGYSYIEPAYIQGYLDFDETAFSPEQARVLRRQAEGSGLRVHSVSAHMDLSLPSAEAMLRRRVNFAAELGASCLTTNTGPAARGDTVIRTLNAVAKDCESSQIVIGLENPGHGSGDLLGDGAAGADFMRRLDRAHVRLNYDAANVFTYSQETRRPENDVEFALPWLVGVHLKDVASVGVNWCFKALGEGQIANGAIIARLPPEIPLTIELPLRLARLRRSNPSRQAQLLAIPELRAASVQSLAFVKAALGKEASAPRS